MHKVQAYGWLVSLTVFVAPSVLSAQESKSGLAQGLSARIARVVSDFRESEKIPGISVAVARNNQLLYSEGFGYSDLEHKVAASAVTKYRTASIAKPISATVAMLLEREGKLDLDQDVSELVESFPRKRWSVTSRQLLGHLGGIRHYKSTQEASSTQHFFSLESALRTFADDPLIHQPGTKYRYSSFGYNLLGSVCEAVSGFDFPSLLKQKVFEPTGMNDTVVDDVFAVIPNRSRGYIKATESLLTALPDDHNLRVGEIYNSTLHDTSMKIPGGGLLSTPADLVRFATGLNRGQLLDEKARKTMWTRQKLSNGGQSSYGLGWNVGRKSGRRAVWHTGGQSGTSTVLLLYPDTGTCVSLMCNLQRTSLVKTAVAIAELMDPPEYDYRAAIERLETAIRAEVGIKDLPAFSMSIVDGDTTVWAEGFGFQDSEKKDPATAETVYRVGSVSKLFTDIAVMQLVENGKVDLDAPIQDYLPEFKPENPYGVPQTLRQMMSHRSGLVRESPVGNYFDPDEPTLAETVASLNQTKLVYKPESRTKYSNAAIAVVGSVLESQLSVSHPQRVRESVFERVEMPSSSFTVTPAIESKMATGWMWTYDGRRFEAPTFLLGTGPAGNLYSNVVDLAKFMSCLFNGGRTEKGPILSPKSLAEMTTSQKDANGDSVGFGLGFHVSSFDGHTKIGHGGAVYGFSTQFEALPERKLGVVACSSLDGSNGVVTRLSNYALRLMLAVQDETTLPDYKVTADVPPPRAKEMAGRYEEVDGKRVTEIIELNGRLLMKRGTTQQDIRALPDNGGLVNDSPIAFGTSLTIDSQGELRVGDVAYRRMSDEPPKEIPDRWKGLIGEYGWDHNTLYILENHGTLYALIEWFYYYPLKEVSENEFEFPDYGLYHGEGLRFTRDSKGFATEVNAAEVMFKRREVGTKDGETFKITPVQPIDSLRSEALAAEPPTENGDFRNSELRELVKLDNTIALDIRYATTNNFTGAVFYQQPRAFMQKPAAEAVVRANQKLKSRGLGLMIHDAYRPWHVTKMFWDATPSELKDFVANPANGSRHNRGCAVDLTLYDLTSGKPIQMVAGYDEFSPRSFPLYPGGTSRQRWYRHLLRETMESEGFSVYEFEWWHFDYQDWKKYRIGNKTFSEITGE